MIKLTLLVLVTILVVGCSAAVVTKDKKECPKFSIFCKK